MEASFKELLFYLGPSGILVRRHVRYGTFGLDSILWTAQPSGQRVYSPPQFEPRCNDAAERFCGHQQFQQPQCRPQLGPHQRALTHLNPSHREGTFLTASKSNFLTILAISSFHSIKETSFIIILIAKYGIALSITLHVPEFLPFIISSHKMNHANSMFSLSFTVFSRAFRRGLFASILCSPLSLLRSWKKKKENSQLFVWTCGEVMSDTKVHYRTTQFVFKKQLFLLFFFSSFFFLYNAYMIECSKLRDIWV